MTKRAFDYSKFKDETGRLLMTKRRLIVVSLKMKPGEVP